MLLKRQIKALRRNCHLSQKDLAIELGITRQHIYYIERGARLPSKKIISQLAEILNCNPEWLMEYRKRDLIDRIYRSP